MCKFFYCPVCGHETIPFPAHPNWKKTCFCCKSKIVPVSSKYDYDYYRNKSMELYGDYLHWKDVFISEELSLNPQYDYDNVKNKIEHYFFIYCPICGKGKTQSDFNINSVTTCPNCKQTVVLKKSKNDNEYYRNKSMALYGDYTHWKDIFFEEDLSLNQEFNAQLYTDPILVYNPQQSQPNTPKCPTCQSTNIKKISTTNRLISVATLGLASSKIGKQFECKNCGYKW